MCVSCYITTLKDNGVSQQKTLSSVHQKPASYNMYHQAKH